MTIEKLYEILTKLVSVDTKLKLQTSLEQIRDSLANLAGQPAATQHQANLGTALAAFTTGAKRLEENITPSEWAAIEELDATEFYDPSIADKVRTSVERNAMTPAVARDYVQDIATRRATFIQTVKETIQGLKNLGVPQAEKKAAPPAEAAFSVPRTIFHEQLGAFARELQFIDRLLRNMNEALTGESQPTELVALSSSTPTVAVFTSLGALKLLGVVVNSFLDAWKKVEEIRMMREKLKSLGFVSATALDEMTAAIAASVKEVVEESTKLSLAEYRKDSGRRNELDNALRRDLHRLFGQIERGLTVELKINVDDKATSSSDELKQIADIVQKMRFPEPAKEPMLLANGEIIEDETVNPVTTKRTATTEKQTKKKGSEAPSGAED